MYSDAVSWLKDALSKDTDVYSIEKICTYFALSEVLAYKDLKESVEYSKLAVDFSKKATDIPRYYIVKVLGEYIIAL